MIANGNSIAVYKIKFPQISGGGPVVDWAYGAVCTSYVSSFIDEKSFGTDYSVMLGLINNINYQSGILYTQDGTLYTKLLSCSNCLTTNYFYYDSYIADP